MSSILGERDGAWRTVKVLHVHGVCQVCCVLYVLPSIRYILQLYRKDAHVHIHGVCQVQVCTCKVSVCASQTYVTGPRKTTLIAHAIKF